MRRPNFLKSVVIILGVILFFSLISVGERFGVVLIASLLTLGTVMLACSLGVQLKKAIIRPAHRLYSKDFSLRFVATLMGFFLLVGTLLYLYVFYTISHDDEVTSYLGHQAQFSNIEYLLRSLVCSLDLFMLDVDSNILDRLDGHAALKGWLSIQAVLSFACTIVMLVGLVYSRLQAFYRLNYATKITDSKNHLYLFFGCNEPSELLIEDIVKNDPKAIAIIIDQANVKDDNDSEWDRIVGLIAHKHSVFKKAQKIGANVAIASQQLDDIDRSISSLPDFDAFGYLGISKIRKLIMRLASTANPQLHIFFMADDEELNIRNIITLAKDATIASVAQQGDVYHRIYCHARYNGPNRVIQDVALKKHLNLKIVDSSHLSVELLKLVPSCHPVNVVKLSPDCPTAVESPFKALIIGFGEVGRDAFRFLYEFGTFLSPDGSGRSGFECAIVDKNLDDIKGTFMASMPGIFKYDKDAGRLGSEAISFHCMDFNSEEFYSEVLLRGDFLSQVNYVVISIGNNDEAIALATRIFSQVRKVRENLDDLRIFVRCTENNKEEGIQKIADHYNYGYGRGFDNIPVIRIFGQPAKTYTYGLVVSDSLIEKGKLFHEKYRQLSGGGDDWDTRHRKNTDTKQPSIDRLRKLRRQESQDMANALHVGTKLILLERAMEALARKRGERLDWYKFYLDYFNSDGSANMEGSGNQIRYPKLSAEENEIIRNLAILEHLRWNAAHELMGYVHSASGGCDERAMKHNCLCSWAALDALTDCDYKKYDYCVVDTTIALTIDHLIARQ